MGNYNGIGSDVGKNAMEKFTDVSNNAMQKFTDVSKNAMQIFTNQCSLIQKDLSTNKYGVTVQLKVQQMPQLIRALNSAKEQSQKWRGIVCLLIGFALIYFAIQTFNSSPDAIMLLINIIAFVVYVLLLGFGGYACGKQYEDWLGKFVLSPGWRSFIRDSIVLLIKIWLFVYILAEVMIILKYMKENEYRQWSFWGYFCQKSHRHICSSLLYQLCGILGILKRILKK